ncbi:YcgL domain-containing protein [Dickeya chrysanthemi]|uniref:YcgL domain-containing protein n=1 Tax=Dickeya chrysanthemi TaxID=556 RepID=UPI000532D174|nr:YcgL domain-containing protein [Dickeya chrysanthemi]
MYCVIYRSSRREQTYLYVEKKDDFSRVPEELMKSFGQPHLVMILPLDGSKKLASADIEKVKQMISDQGFYLQLPPPPENLWDELQASVKK